MGILVEGDEDGAFVKEFEGCNVGEEDGVKEGDIDGELDRSRGHSTRSRHTLHISQSSGQTSVPHEISPLSIRCLASGH